MLFAHLCPVGEQDLRSAEHEQWFVLLLSNTQLYHCSSLVSSKSTLYWKPVPIQCCCLYYKPSPQFPTNRKVCGVTQLISSAAIASRLLHRSSCTRNCLAHWCASCTPSNRVWVLSPVILQLPAHLISLPITSYLKLGSLEEASVSNLKGEFPGLLRVSCLLKRKKPSKSSPSHCPAEVCPGKWPFWQRLFTVKDL